MSPYLLYIVSHMGGGIKKLGGTMENVKVCYYPIPLSFLPSMSRKLTLER